MNAEDVLRDAFIRSGELAQEVAEHLFGPAPGGIETTGRVVSVRKLDDTSPAFEAKLDRILPPQERAG